MVMRISPKMEIPEEFTGILSSWEITPEREFDGKMTRQIQLNFVPEEGELEGFHDWVTLSEKAEDAKIPEGSILDKYVTEIEFLLPETKSMTTWKEVFGHLVGKRMKWGKKKLGKAFGKYAAKEYMVPKQVL